MTRLSSRPGRATSPVLTSRGSRRTTDVGHIAYSWARSLAGRRSRKRLDPETSSVNLLGFIKRRSGFASSLRPRARRLRRRSGSAWAYFGALDEELGLGVDVQRARVVAVFDVAADVYR